MFGNGKGSYFAGNLAIGADIKTSLMTFLGECFFATNFGIDWWNLLGSSGADKIQAQILEQSRKAILQVQGVVNIPKVTTSRVSRTLYIQYTVNTVFGTQINGNIPITLNA